MKTILYFYPVRSSFVISDEEILSGVYTVKKFFFNGLKKIRTPIYFFLQLIFILRHIHHTDKMIAQFSGYHSFLPALAGRVFHKPLYIILHGTECNNFPEYHYGYINRPLLFWFSKTSLSWATKLIPVSETLVHTDYTYQKTTYVKQGYKNFYPPISTPYVVVNNGVSPERFAMENMARNPRTFITVAAGLNSSIRRIIKGIDLVIELAKQTPENIYTIVGTSGTLDLDLPANIHIVDYVPNDKISAYYNAHAFYLQLSVSEGFVVSVCEAMLCGCVPVVSNVGASSLIAGSSGYILQKKNIDELLLLIQKAIEEYTPEKMSLARKHILDHFTAEERRKRLLRVIEN